jgi:hypothetical protein
MDEEELAREIAHFWSEWTDDMAPLRERSEYYQAAKDFLTKYSIEKKE